MSSRYYMLSALALLSTILLTVWLYWQGLHGPFVLDDLQNVVMTYTHVLSLEEIIYAATHNTSGLLGRPVSALSLYFSGILHGPDPWAYKYHNLALHLLNGLLLFWLLLRILPALSKDLSHSKLTLLAGLTVLLWLLHPLMVSTVLYVVQRMAMLAALFTLAALLCYVKLRQMPSSSVWRFRILAYGLFPLLVVLAVFSKESGALIPLYVLLIEWLVFRFRYGNDQERKRWLKFFVVFVALPLLLACSYYLINLDRFTNFSARDFGLVERLMTQLHAWVFYLKLIFLPKLSEMTLFHDYFPVQRSMDFLTFILLCLLLLVVALIWLLRNKAPVIAFGLAWFLISHLMESTVFNLELVFEHRNYMAAAGLLLIPLYYLSTSLRFHWLQYVPLLLVPLFAFMTMARVQEWSNEEAFYSLAVSEHPQSMRAQTYAANRSFNINNPRQALSHLDTARKYWPRDIGPLMHEIVYRCNLGVDFSEQWEEARHLVTSTAMTNYGISGLEILLSLYQRGYCSELRLSAVRELVHASLQQPGTASNANRSGYLYKVIGQSYLISRDFESGAEALFRAYELTGMAVILMDLLEIQMQFGLLAEAADTLEYLENVNMERYGIESARLNPLRERFLMLKARADQHSDGQTVTQEQTL